MFTDSHCHIEDDATAFRAGEAGVDVILNAGKDLDEAAAQLLMCERMDSLRAAQSAAGRGGPAGVAGELNGTGAGGGEGTGAGDGDGGSGENEQSAGRGSEACGGTMKRIIPQMWTSAGGRLRRRKTVDNPGQPAEFLRPAPQHIKHIVLRLTLVNH